MINQNFVENLPIDGENIVSLAALLPGVSNVNAPTTFTSDTGGPTYSVAGSRGNQNLFLLDGSIWNNVFYNTGLNFPPRLALQEVSVLLNNYKAQYGRNSGSIFNAITRSGSDQIHGSVWEYLQNQVFNASDYFLGPIVGGTLHLVSNQFGATIGGPIIRNKMFYFLAFQDLRLAGQVAAAASTPTAAEFGLTPSGAPYPCTAGGQFSGQQCANFTADFCFVAGPNCPSPVTQATAVRNPINASIGGATAIQSLNATWQQAGNVGQSPCVSALMPYISSKYLANPELPAVCFDPVNVAFINRYSGTGGSGGGPEANTNSTGSRFSAATSTPFGIAVDRNGNLWMANSGASGTVADTYSSISYLAVSNNSSTGTGGIMSSVTSTSTAGGLNIPQDIEIDGNNNAWVANYTQNAIGVGAVPYQISEFSFNGTTIVPVTSGGLSTGTASAVPSVKNARGVAIDASGNIWIANNNSAASYLTVLVGAAGPVITPKALAVGAKMIGQKP
jgi:hypothetical protein